ncbi:prealbumin-like fold domain-containing protein [Brevibacillus formosus]|uniref:prealbumin-like fold domain-containing protein n=1 Tax=Brevibacillus TaxID=55080 RepID=UPI000D0E90DF|nr:MULTISPECIES: prealbumin-like fold domain-containing protein [Brevibacillus]MBG9944388.1 hypothetical protein [Brevibacillus formosus]MED1946275.1 prealbumin-like fold domain-containing protein [Brevibacillus formosus]MED1998803.1 prealbumin-like fold domain-containing protein [Brevibacillus formosus]MED2084140.1 prealbumin-like fold domain-containing protein [Brevibacillus formosus]PSK18175.1 hypothetical protein C7R94_13465 [Brevibacillus sp. NRRL NRS-603]
MSKIKSVLTVLALFTAMTSVSMGALASENRVNTSSDINIQSGVINQGAKMSFKYEKVTTEITSEKSFSVSEGEKVYLTVVQWSGGWFAPKVKYAIVTNSGGEVKSEVVLGRYTDKNHTVTFSDVPPGTYYIKVINQTMDPIYGNGYIE